ncbi:unnamed protein product [Rotaria sordida]|uniref:protein-serine/threonine phosphatase n=1 Tax=Rotaria sordida TaxID=392033 RepID=A0A814EAE3_9BILA|nr:unnamed protein product [Rotaria sordida]
MNKLVQVWKIMVYRNSRLTKHDIIFIMIDTDGQKKPFLSSISGIVNKLYINQLDYLSYGSIILEYSECKHKITFKNLCCDCGIDLNQFDNTLPTSDSTKIDISMEPLSIEATISREEPLRYDYEEHNHLINKRKLNLLINVDNTLVDTITSKFHYPFSSDVIDYQITPISPTYYTNLRPGVKQFLINLRSLYKFNLVTFGDQLYANKIAKIIDPNGRFFSDRILSYGQSILSTNNKLNLNDFFPYDDSLVCIIDQREDLWNYIKNLICVKPYIWFKRDNSSNDSYQFTQKLKEGNNDQTTITNHLTDQDYYLQKLEIILKRIHTEFYNEYDKWIKEKHGNIPDLKEIIPNIRQQVLNSVSLCFSHLMPPNFPIEKHRASIMAQSLGAKVTNDLQFNSNGTIQTTHIVAGKPTLKVYYAKKYNVKVVTPEWLIDCYQQWEHKLEDKYILNKDYQVQKSKLFMKEEYTIFRRHYYHHLQQQQSQTYQINNTNFYNKIASEGLFDQYNFTVTTNERFNIEKGVNDLSIEDQNDDNTIYTPPTKQQRTMNITQIIDKNKNKINNEHFHSDPSTIYIFNSLNLDDKDKPNIDEENFHHTDQYHH